MYSLKSKIQNKARALKQAALSKKLPALIKPANKTNLALHKFVLKGDIQKVTDLINNNYKIINERDNNFKTALDYALSTHKADIIGDLVLLGARVSMTFYDCKSDSGFLKILHLLEQVDYNYNNIDGLGFAPIHYASGQGFQNSVKFLLQKKVDINIQSIHGETALKYALKHNRSGLIAGDC
ncbi:MAG: hypothetical protein HON23_02510 [Rickettsiales bacterium]|jgi:ankyrin repeat protein|nr:hypothetical protein [Rickettsiales bacterium]